MPAFGEITPPPPQPASAVSEAAQRAVETAREAGQAVQQTAQEWTDAAKEKSAELIARQNVRVDRNPGRAVIEAFLVGLAIGVLLRLLQSPRRKEKPKKIDVQRKPTLEETKYHLGSVLLPFLWPALQTARRQASRSKEKVQGAIEQVQDTDFRKLGRDSAKKVEKWMDEEIAPVAECGWKRLRNLWT